MSDRSPEERAFLNAYDVSQFERPSVAVDVAILTAHDGDLYLVVHRRTEHPDKGRLAMPGGFVRIDESLENGARRLLESKGKLRDVFLEQLYTFGDPGRDPRTRVITVGYYALVNYARLAATGATLARVIVPWEGETGGPVELEVDGAVEPAAFDHEDIAGMAVKRIRGKLDYTPIGFQLLPERFTLRALQEVHETVLGKPLNRDSFRRRMLATGLLEATGERESDTSHRPAELYRFVRRSAV